MHSLAKLQERTHQPIGCDLRRKAVLLVEPDPDLRFMLKALLTRDGCIVDACETLIDALPAVSYQHFDLAITYGAPGIDGLLLLYLLRERGSATPCVVISTQHAKEPYLLAMNLGALDYFVTPLDYAALQRLIHTRI